MTVESDTPDTPDTPVSEAAPEPVDNSVSPAPAPAKRGRPAKVDPAPEVADAEVTVKPRSVPDRPSPKGAVVSGNRVDTVEVSKLVRNDRARKSLSVHHLQRRLGDLGYSEAVADIDGFYGLLTSRSVEQWQEASGWEVGALTLPQAQALFARDPNVEVVA